MTAGVDLRYTYNKWWSFARHNWHGEWNPHPDQKHVGVLNLLHGVQMGSWRFPVLDLKVCAKQVRYCLPLISRQCVFGESESSNATRHVFSVTRLRGVVVRTLDLRLRSRAQFPATTLPGYFWHRWPYFAGKLSWDITTTQVNSALHPSGVAKSSTSFGWGKGGKVTAASWQVTLCDVIWHMISRSGEVISTNCYIRYTLTSIQAHHHYRRRFSCNFSLKLFSSGFPR